MGYVEGWHSTSIPHFHLQSLENLILYNLHRITEFVL